MLKKLVIFFLIEYAYSYVLKTNTIIKPRDGCDERLPIKSDELKNIIDNYKKYELLNKLTSNQISIIEKLDLIETNIIKPFNITNGGLLDDFNFNFDTI
jgi:hypothetical protein